MVKLKRNLLSVSLMSAMTLSATGAFAQSAEQAAEQETNNEAAVELETVTVTGIRAGIESAIAVKRDSTSIVEAVSANGGHLGSNLGVVELTIAMHRVFDSPRDVLLWDTGEGEDEVFPGPNAPLTHDPNPRGAFKKPADRFLPTIDIEGTGLDRDGKHGQAAAQKKPPFDSMKL